MAEIVQDGYGNDAGTMLSLSEYAAKIGMSTRQIKRWLSGDAMYELPGATKDPVTDEWLIPSNAVKQLRASNAATTQPQDHSAAPLALVPTQGAPGTQMLPWQPAEAPQPSLLEDLDDEPAFLDLDTAARYLGIPKAQIAANRERFAVEPVGLRGSLRVPQRVVRRIMGV